MATLQDFLQSMSNSAASNVSAPVDGINWLMRKAGLPVSDAPVGGSDWLAKMGFTRPVEQNAASLAGETAAMLAPFAVAAKAPQIAKGLLQAGENLAAPTQLSKQAGAVLIAPPRMSAAEAQAAGYWHPIGDGKKLTIPFSQMTAGRTEIGNLIPRKIISPERLQGGVLVPASGDRTIAGQMLNEVGGIKLPNPVELEGGADFMRTHSPFGSVWASEQSVITKLANNIRKASDISQDVYMPYVAMGHNSANFNTMMSDALLEQIKGGSLYKKDIKAFDKALKAERSEWGGLLSDNARSQLNENGALRHAFVNRMQLDDFQNAGFPNIATTRFAITEPKLMDAPLHSSGFAVSKVDPTGRAISNPVRPHSTYNTQLAGEYVGGLDQQIPRDVMFPQWAKARRDAGIPTSGDPRSFQLANPIQPANQEWLDGVMNWLQANPTSP